MVTTRPRRVSKADADGGGMFWFLGSIRSGLLRGVTRDVARTRSEQVEEIQNRMCTGRIRLVINPDG